MAEVEWMAYIDADYADFIEDREKQKKSQPAFPHCDACHDCGFVPVGRDSANKRHRDSHAPDCVVFWRIGAFLPPVEEGMGKPVDHFQFRFFSFAELDGVTIDIVPAWEQVYRDFEATAVEAKK